MIRARWRGIAAALAALLLLAACATVPGPSAGDAPLAAVAILTEDARLLAGDGAGGDFFGFSVAVSGDTAVIGAYRDDDNGDSSGSAYVFVRSGGGWTQQAKLLAGDGAAGDQFGYSVAVSGDTVVVGANLDDDNGTSSGSAYVFVRSAGVWTQQAKLFAAAMGANDQFGTSVAASGGTALIGAVSDDDGGTNAGAAYVFVRSGGAWTQQAKLLAGDSQPNDQFGFAVALSGDDAVIGAVSDDDNGSNAGSAYVFARSGGIWTQQAKLLAANGAETDRFGTSVALSGDTALVGARFDDDNGTNSGSAYAFTRSGGIWTQQKLLASDGTIGDSFGISVAVSGDTAVIGAVSDDDNGDSSGSAYVFVRSGGSWIEQDKLLVSDGAAADQFGFALALSGGTAVVGAYADDDNGPESGSGYVFAFNDPPVAMDDRVTTRGSSVTIDVLANDSDPDGDPIAVDSVTQGTNGGRVVVTSGGAVRYTRSDGDFNGTDTFTYTIVDGQGGSANATVRVTVLVDLDLRSCVVLGDDVTLDPKADIEDCAIIGDGVTIAADAKIENDVEIGAGSSIGVDATVKEDAVLGANVTVTEKAEIRERVVVGAGSVVGFDAQIEEDAVLGADVTLGPRAKVQKRVEIGAGSSLGDEAVVEEDAVLGENVTLGAKAKVKKHARIGAGSTLGVEAVVDEDAVLGANVTVTEKAEIRKRVVVGAGSVVGFDAQIEEDAVLGANVTLGTKAKVQKRVEIGAGSSLGDEAVVEEDAVLGENVTVGDAAKVKNEAHLGAGVIVGRDAEVKDRAVIGAGSLVGNDATIGKEAIVAENITIGARAEIGDRAIIRADVPAGKKIDNDETWP